MCKLMFSETCISIFILRFGFISMLETGTPGQRRQEKKSVGWVVVVAGLVESASAEAASGTTHRRGPGKRRQPFLAWRFAPRKKDM